MRAVNFEMRAMRRQMATMLTLCMAAVMAPLVVPDAAAADDPTYADIILADSPLAYYRLTETTGGVAEDASGHDRDATIVGSPTRNLAGPVADGKAFQHGSADRLTIPRIDFSGQALSVEAWVRTRSTADSSSYEGDPALTLFGDHTNDVWFSFGVDGGTLKLSRHSLGDGWQSIDGSTRVNDGRWHHVVATTSAASQQGAVYVDGYLDGYGSLPVSTPDLTGLSRISSGYQDRDRYIGEIAEPAIYNSILSPTDVAAHHAAAGPQSDAPTATTDYPSLVLERSPLAYYRMGDTGSVAADSAADGRDGSYVGMPSLGVPGALVNDSDTATALTGGQRVDVPPPELPLANFTVEAWVKTTNTDATHTYEGNPGLTILGDHRSTVWFSFGIDGGRLRLGRHGDPEVGWRFVDGAINIADGEWHHVVATTSASTSRTAVYVDGNLDGLSTLPISDDDLSAVTRLGAGYQSLDPLEASLDEVAIYPGILAPAEIRAHFKAGSGYEPVPVADVLNSHATLTALQNRVEEIASVCPEVPANATSYPSVQLNVLAGTCNVTYTSNDCGWRQFFCDHKDQIIFAIAATALVVVAGLLVAAAVTYAAPTLAAAWASMSSTAVPLSGLGAMTVADGAAVAIVGGGYAVTVAVANINVQVLTVADVQAWLNHYSENHNSDGSPKTGDLGEDWTPRPAREIPGSKGCETWCAQETDAKVLTGRLHGGTVHRIKHRLGDTFQVGIYRGYESNWHWHEVVKFNGRVYDQFGPRTGVPVAEWKALWGDAEYLVWGGL